VQDVLVVQVREYDQLVVEGVVVGGKASPVVLEVYPDEVVELVVYHGGRVQDELVVVEEDVVVGGKASPVVLDV
jgi:transcriptional regulator of NAD metabolism